MGKYEFKYDYLAHKLERIIEVKDGDRVFFTEIFLIKDIESILESAYNFDIEIPESQKLFIIQGGIEKFAFQTKKDGKQLRLQIKKSETEFLKKPSKKYSMLSSLSFPYFSELKNIVFTNGTVKFFRNYYPQKYKFDNIYDQLKEYSDFVPPNGYLPIVVNIIARNNLEAIEKGLNLLDLIRGIWNFSINKRVSNRIHIGPIEPINTIRLGPTHTLHFSNGQLAQELFWYEPDYKEKSSTWDVENKWKFISKDFIWTRNALNKLPYKSQFSEIFIRYAKSLDTINYETSYLKLWSLLELLTNTINSNYDKTISRALFFYKDSTLSKEMIEHLRIFRNKIVHYGESKGEMDSALLQIKRIVEKLIWFHLKFSSKFSSIEEFGRFLDLSKDKNILENEIILREKALKFLYKQ